MLGTRAISTTSRRELSSIFFFLQGKAPKEIHAILTETFACFLHGRAKDLSAPLYMLNRFADSSQAVNKPVLHIPLLCVQWKTPDDGQRNCPKHVELYSKNKLEKLVHLVDFIIRIYHDARSPESQIIKGM